MSLMFGDMSRIGNSPIIIPENVTVQVDGQTVKVEGPKGMLERVVHPVVKVEVSGKQAILERKRNDRLSRSVHGLTRSLINNMVVGVTEGFSRGLELVGVGYRATGGGDNLTLTVGFSHPVTVTAPAGVSFTVADNTKITVSGIDKELVGQVAANIRSIKPPEVYKGKGIRYEGEIVRRKPGKAAKGMVVGGAKG